MLTTELTTVYLDTADLTQADIEQGEAHLLEAVHCPEHHRGRGHAEMMVMCQRSWGLSRPIGISPYMVHLINFPLNVSW